MKSKVWLSITALLLTASLMLAGCNSSKSPQEALKDSMAKAAEIKSYSFQGSLKIEDLKISASGSDSGAAAMLDSFRNMDLSWKGVYKADPMLMEMTLSLALKGDLAVNLNVPVVMNKEKIWVKVPNIPMLPLPENVVGKFLEIDLKKLAEQSGQPMPNIDPGKSQQFMNDVLAIIFKNVDEKQYLSDVKVKDAGLPSDVDVKQVVRFKVGKDQVEPFVNTVVDKIAPELLDLLSKNEDYRKMLGLKPEDLDKAKSELDKTKKEDVSKGLADFKKQVKSLEVTANVGIDSKEYPVYNDIHVSTVVDDNGQSTTVAFKIVSQMSDINKDVKSEIGEPKDVVTMDQFEKEMGGMFGGDASAGELNADQGSAN